MTRKLLIFCIAVLAAISACAQFKASAPDPVKWKLSIEMTSDTEGVATLTADIEPGWHLYGTDLPQGGPQPTVIKFGVSPTESGVTEGPVTPSATPAGFDDPDWGMHLTWWEKSVSFSQAFRLTAPDASITATATFMVCNGEQCIPTKVVHFKLPAADTAQRQ